MNRAPYVGITGITKQEEVKRILDEIDDSLWGDYKLMAGILVDSRTLQGQNNDRPSRYPKVEDISRIIFEDPRVIWLVHYSSHNRSDLLEELDELLAAIGPPCNGIQFNIAWPHHILVQRCWKKITQWTEHPRIVLQINETAMRIANCLPSYMVDRVEKYMRERIVTDVLFDTSGGRGQKLDPERYRPYLEALQERCPYIHTGVAGGLNLYNIPDLLRPIQGLFDNIDVESGIRHPNADTVLFPETHQFVREGLQFLQQ